jgi:hypothetical protein
MIVVPSYRRTVVRGSLSRDLLPVRHVRRQTSDVRRQTSDVRSRSRIIFFVDVSLRPYDLRPTTYSYDLRPTTHIIL